MDNNDITSSRMTSSSSLSLLTKGSQQSTSSLLSPTRMSTENGNGLPVPKGNGTSNNHNGMKHNGQVFTHRNPYVQMMVDNVKDTDDDVDDIYIEDYSYDQLSQRGYSSSDESDDCCSVIHLPIGLSSPSSTSSTSASIPLTSTATTSQTSSSTLVSFHSNNFCDDDEDDNDDDIQLSNDSTLKRNLFLNDYEKHISLYSENNSFQLVSPSNNLIFEDDDESPSCKTSTVINDCIATNSNNFLINNNKNLLTTFTINGPSTSSSPYDILNNNSFNNNNDNNNILNINNNNNILNNNINNDDNNNDDDNNNNNIANINNNNNIIRKNGLINNPNMNAIARSMDNFLMNGASVICTSSSGATSSHLAGSYPILYSILSTSSSQQSLSTLSPFIDSMNNFNVNPNNDNINNNNGNGNNNININNSLNNIINNNNLFPSHMITYDHMDSSQSMIDLPPPPFDMDLMTTTNPVLPFSVSNNQYTLEEPIAILSAKDNSYSFMERRIPLTKQVKVGRSIGHTRPSIDNAIFNCKVLSRNHALLWYQDGKFYLKDTCSSNGTFVNNQRLSPANERSPPQILYSGDCIQFGVDVTEKKNVHSCVIATIRLFYPDGTEAKKEYSRQVIEKLDVPESPNFLNLYLNISHSQMTDLVCHIKKSIRKQTMLENKLDSMRVVMKETLNSAKCGWKSLVEEDRLLSRIQTLQSQLEVCLIAKNTELPQDIVIEALKEKNLQLIADKEKFEQQSKESLKKSLEEKIIFEANLQAIKMELDVNIQQCKLLKDSLDLNFNEMKELVDNYDKIKKEKEELIAKVEKYEEEDSKIKHKLVQLKKLFNNNKPITEDQKVQTMATMVVESIMAQHCSSSTQTEEQEVISVEEFISPAIVEENHFLMEIISEFANRIDYIQQSTETTFEIIINLINGKLTVVNVIEAKMVQCFALFEKMKQYYKWKIELKNVEIGNLNEKIEDYKQINYAQMAENSKFKCDIDTLKVELQNMEREKVKPILKDNSIQTDKEEEKEEETQKHDNEHCNHCSIYKEILCSLQKFDGNIIIEAFGNDEQHKICDNDQHKILDKMIAEKLTEFSQEYRKIKTINENLVQETNMLKNRFKWLSLQNEVSFCIGVLPLIIIFVAIVLTFYQPLSFIMGTFGL